MSGEKTPRLHQHFDINAVMAVSLEGACYVRRAGRMTCTRPAALNYSNPRAHWPKVSEAWGQASISIWALKGATHRNRRNLVKSLDSGAIGPLRGPIQFLLAYPRPHEVFRPVRPGVKDSQGRWPCAGLQPAKLSPDNGFFVAVAEPGTVDWAVALQWIKGTVRPFIWLS